MTIYGDLDLSIIDQLPPNRKPVTTSVLNQNKKEMIISKLNNHINARGQVYWVCPLIETSKINTLQDIKSLLQIITKKLPKALIGVIHGKMKIR